MTRLPLRVQLPLVATALLLVGVLSIGVAAVQIVERSLAQQIDSRLETAVNDVQARPGRIDADVDGDEDASPAIPSAPTEFVLLVYRADGQLAVPLTTRVNDGRTLPNLEVDLGQAEPQTVRDGLQRWRVLVRPVRNQHGWLAVALPLRDVEAAERGLRRTVVAVSLVTAALGALFAFWFTRRSLRPLAAAEATAARIAGGDLSSRVPEESPRTEAGALAGSLNRMLDRLQESFQAQQATESRLRRFVSDASHELRTPLTAIRGYAELHGAGGGNADEAMRRIESNAVRMAGLVDDLLMLARHDETPEALKGDTDVDLAILAADAAADTRVLAPDREVTLATPEHAVWVRGSERHLRQVIANLCGNAVRHTPGRSPIEITVSSVGAEAVLTVRDQGPGIPEADRDKVFERFYRLDESRTRETGGTGLGLAIVAAIVAAHVGTVRVEDGDSAGGGAAVVVTLPLAHP